MRSPLRFVRRQWEYAGQAGRRRELEAEFGEFLGTHVRFVSAGSKGGYDQIYLALSASNPVAVVRVNNPRRVQYDPIGPLDPGIPLGPAERLTREWDAYSRLAPLALSPTPLWRTTDAIACSWSPWGRLSAAVLRRQVPITDAIARTFSAISKMHAAGVVHLDLNSGNVLFEESGAGTLIVDFEFGPTDWVTEGQQMAFDYLRLLDDLLRPRRGGTEVLSDIERIVATLDTAVPTSIRNAPLRFCFGKLKRLASEQPLRDRLTSVFAGLED